MSTPLQRDDNESVFESKFWSEKKATRQIHNFEQRHTDVLIREPFFVAFTLCIRGLSGIGLSQKGPIGVFRDLLRKMMEHVLQIGVQDGSRHITRSVQMVQIICCTLVWLTRHAILGGWKKIADSCNLFSKIFLKKSPVATRGTA